MQMSNCMFSVSVKCKSTIKYLFVEKHQQLSHLFFNQRRVRHIKKKKERKKM